MKRTARIAVVFASVIAASLLLPLVGGEPNHHATRHGFSEIQIERESGGSFHATVSPSGGSVKMSVVRPDGMTVATIEVPAGATSTIGLGNSGWPGIWRVILHPTAGSEVVSHLDLNCMPNCAVIP